MKKFKFALIALLSIAIMSLTSCRALWTPADTTRDNIQNDADSFDVYRRMTFINLRSTNPAPLYSVEGYFSVQVTEKTEYAGQQELGILIEVGKDEYMLNYFGLGDGVTYIIEQLKNTHTDPYHYEILWYIPFPAIEEA